MNNIDNPLDLSESAIKQRNGQKYLEWINDAQARVMSAIQGNVDAQVSIAISRVPLAMESMDKIKERLTVVVHAHAGKVVFHFDDQPIVEFEKPEFSGSRYEDGVHVNIIQKYKHLNLPKIITDPGQM